MPDVIAPAEVPVEMNAFKSQQHRWAKGSIQTCRKLLPRILRADMPARRQGGGVLSPDGELQLPADVRPLGADVPGDGDPLQHGLVRDAAHRRAAVLRGHLLGLQLLHGLSARDSSRLARADAVPAVPDVDRHRALHQQHQGGLRGAVQQAHRVHANAEVPDRRRRRRVGRQEVPPVGRRSSRSSSWPSASISRGRCSTRLPTRSTARCRSWCCSRSASSILGSFPSSSSTPRIRWSSRHRLPAVNEDQKSRVLRVSPDTILSDIDRLVDLAGVSSGARSPAGRRSSRTTSPGTSRFPAANTTPWQLEGTIQALARRGFADQVCVQNKTVVTNAFKGEDLNHYVPIFKRYDIPVLYNFKDDDMTWVALRAQGEDARPRTASSRKASTIPDYFFGKNIVHLPTTKCHIYTTTTGAMKNAFGGLLNTRRHYTHSWIHETLVDLLAIQKEIHPGLFAIMDGTTAGNGPGPRTMYPVVKNVMLASADQVAIDAVSAKMMGFDPMSLDYIRLAHEDGLGVGDPRDIEIVGDVDAARENWQLPRRREPGPRRRRRPDLVRSAQAVPEAVLPHAARERLHPRQRRLPRLLPLAARRPPRLRAVVRDDRVGPDVPALRADGPAGRAGSAPAKRVTDRPPLPLACIE